MLIASKLIKKSHRDGQTPLDSVTLDSEGRYRRRVRVTSDGGRDVLIDLADTVFMHHGDVLECGEGLIEVRAAAEPLLEIKVQHPLAMARVAWHLGNRHTTAELTEDALYIQPDHVLEDMLRRLGAAVAHVTRPFDPEIGAYHHGHHHDDHGH
jgi:urease accessory protein